MFGITCTGDSRCSEMLSVSSSCFFIGRSCLRSGSLKLLAIPHPIRCCSIRRLVVPIAVGTGALSFDGGDSPLDAEVAVGRRLDIHRWRMMINEAVVVSRAGYFSWPREPRSPSSPWSAVFVGDLTRHWWEITIPDIGSGVDKSTSRLVRPLDSEVSPSSDVRLGCNVCPSFDAPASSGDDGC